MSHFTASSLITLLLKTYIFKPFSIEMDYFSIWVIKFYKNILSRYFIFLICLITLNTFVYFNVTEKLGYCHIQPIHNFTKIKIYFDGLIIFKNTQAFYIEKCNKFVKNRSTLCIVENMKICILVMLFHFPCGQIKERAER